MSNILRMLRWVLLPLVSAVIHQMGCAGKANQIGLDSSTASNSTGEIHSTHTDTTVETKRLNGEERETTITPVTKGSVDDEKLKTQASKEQLTLSNTTTGNTGGQPLSAIETAKDVQLHTRLNHDDGTDIEGDVRSEGGNTQST